MTAFYNEIDPKAAAWLRELIARGHIAPGVVDERDIWDIAPADLLGFTQCHLFAGIGVWSHALRRAGWSDDRPVWTASFPCQPFSAAGKGKGFADERHLWPAGLHLIRELRPAVVFGEQVSSKDGLAWLDLVQADLEGEGYAVGALDTCAAGVGAPHIRQRLYWSAERLADANLGARGERRSNIRGRADRSDAQSRPGPSSSGHVGGLADDDDDAGLEGRGQPGRERAAERPARASGVAGGVADTDGRHPGEERQQRGGEQRQQPQDGGAGGLGNTTSDWPAHERIGDGQAGERPAQQFGPLAGTASRIGDGAVAARGERDATGRAGSARLEHGTDATGPVNGLWRAADWLFCRDGKWRPVEPGTFPLVDGAPARVGRLRGYGNAIVAEAAAQFIESWLDIRTIEGE